MYTFPDVDIFTDGACSGNPGPGGWGAILKQGTHVLEMSGGELMTTNNRMELTAAVSALQQLKVPCNVSLTTDSKYIVDSVNLGWLDSWVRNGWKNSANKPTPNADLWLKLLQLMHTHRVTFKWVKGHAGHLENERCDALARQQRDMNSRSLYTV